MEELNINIKNLIKAQLQTNRLLLELLEVNNKIKDGINTETTS